MEGVRLRRVELMVRALGVATVLVVLPSIFIGDVSWFWRHGLGIGIHHLPYKDFVWEFPPLTAPVLFLVPLCLNSFGLFFVAFSVVMVACELASLRLLRNAVPLEQRRPVTLYWMAVGLPLATIAWFRFDFLAVLLATAAYVRITSGRRSSLTLVGGFAAKLWPAALALLLVTERRWRELAKAAAGSAAVLAGWYLFAPSGFHQFWAYRRGDGLQLESVAGAIKVLVSGGRPEFISGAWVVGSGGYRWVDPLGLLLVGVTGLLVLWATWRRAADPARVCAGLVLVILLSTHLLSPQYLVWPLPFMAALWAKGERRATKVFAAAAFLTVFELAGYHALLTAQRWMAAVVVARNGLLIAAAVLVLAPVLRRTHATTTGTEPAPVLAA